MYYIKLSLTLIMFLTLGACSNQPANTTANNTLKAQSSAQELVLYKEAIVALNNNDLVKAETLFTQMSTLQPNIAGPWANLALINIKNNNLVKAEQQVKVALKKNPKMAQALNLSGHIAAKKGQINLAKSYYQQALINKPDYALAHYNLALLYDIYLQNIPKAIDHYQQYLSHNLKTDKVTESWLKGLKATVAANQS